MAPASQIRVIAAGLALVFAFRMLGMFMVLPVLATYGMELQGSTPALIGLAIGAFSYGNRPGMMRYQHHHYQGTLLRHRRPRSAHVNFSDR